MTKKEQRIAARHERNADRLACLHAVDTLAMSDADVTARAGMTKAQARGILVTVRGWDHVLCNTYEADMAAEREATQ